MTGLVRKPDHQTSASVIPVRPNGDRPAWHCIGANGAFTLDDLPRRSTGSTSSTSAARSSSAARLPASCCARAQELGATTSLDILAPGDPDMLAWVADALPHADYLLPNDEQVLGFTGAVVAGGGRAAPRRRGVGCVAVTQGAKGALVVTADEVIEVPAFEIEVVDTTGCGDAFSAGFLRGISLGRRPARARPGSAAPPRPRWRRVSGPTPGPTAWRRCRPSSARQRPGEGRRLCRHQAVGGRAARPVGRQGPAGALRAALRHLRLRPARARSTATTWPR